MGCYPLAATPHSGSGSLSVLRHYIVIDEVPCPDGTTGREVAAVEDPHRRLSWWEGVAPRRAPPPHPNLSACLVAGRGPEGPAWVESRPRGRSLAQLAGALPDEVIARVLAQVAEGLAALHADELTHGRLGPGTVVVAEGTGAAVLIGARCEEGADHAEILRADVLALHQLLPVALRGTASAGSAASLAASLRQLADDQGALSPQDVVALAPVETPEGATHLVLQVESVSGSFDEVAPALGADPVEPGLFDPWRGQGRSTDTTTGERTGAVAVTSEDHAVTAALAALAQGAGLLEARPELAAAGMRPSAGVKALVADEPVDLLPAPDGLAAVRRDWGPLGERSAEITAIQRGPLGAPTSPDLGDPAETAGEITLIAPEPTADAGLERTDVAVDTADLGEVTRTLGVPTSRGVLLMAIGVILGLVLAIGLLSLWPALR